MTLVALPVAAHVSRTCPLPTGILQTHRRAPIGYCHTTWGRTTVTYGSHWQRLLVTRTKKEGLGFLLGRRQSHTFLLPKACGSRAGTPLRLKHADRSPRADTHVRLGGWGHRRASLKGLLRIKAESVPAPRRWGRGRERLNLMLQAPNGCLWQLGIFQQVSLLKQDNLVSSPTLEKGNSNPLQ